MREGLSGLVGQIKFLVRDFFAHWNTPPKKDYKLSNKEFICYSVGGMGVQAMGIITQYLAITAGLYLAKAYNFDAWIVQITTSIMAFLNLARSPIVGAIIDNTNTKYGRFRPFLLWSGFASTIVFTLLAFVPGMFLGLENKTTAKWMSVIVYQLIYFAGMTIFQFFSYGRVGLAQVITPNTNERTKLYSIGGVIDSLGPSLVQILFPLIATFVDKDNGMNGQRTFQVLTPIFGVLCSGIALIMFFGTKERLILHKNKKVNVKLSRGIRLSFQNKYFWIANISNLIGFSRLMLFGATNYIAMYMIGGTLGKTVMGPMATILGLAFVPGMAFAPLIIKKIGKKKMTIVSFLGSTCIAAFMLLLVLTSYDSKIAPWFMYVGIFLHNMFAALWTVTGPAMTADYCDYQQWKTGDRLDGFMSNFSTMLITIFGIFTGMFTTWLFVEVGAPNSAAYDIPEVMRKVFIIWGIGSIIGGIVATIPYFWWDLTEDKHKELMKQVKKDALTEDISSGDLSQNDVAFALANGLIDEDGIRTLGLTVEYDEDYPLEKIIEKLDITEEIDTEN